MSLRTNFINETNDVASLCHARYQFPRNLIKRPTRLCFYVSDKRFELLLELSTNARARQDSREIDGQDTFILQRLYPQVSVSVIQGITAVQEFTQENEKACLLVNENNINSLVIIPASSCGRTRKREPANYVEHPYKRRAREAQCKG